jgi:hypothetical protein
LTFEENIYAIEELACPNTVNEFESYKKEGCITLAVAM